MRIPFVRSSFRREHVESTSDLARALVAEGGSELPMVVRADHQTRGRGRGDHAWWSDPGSLTFTVALDPAAHGLRPEHELRLALAAAVAVIEALGPFAPGVPLGIRWPNDIEAGGLKLGGILPERVESPAGPRLLIGIGLNVATNLAEAPPEVRRMATTVVELREQPASPRELDDLLAAILDQLGQVMPLLANDDPGLAARWKGLDTLHGHVVRVDLGPRTLVGQAFGIDDRGGLLLRDGARTTTLFGGQVLREPISEHA